MNARELQRFMEKKMNEIMQKFIDSCSDLPFNEVVYILLRLYFSACASTGMSESQSMNIIDLYLDNEREELFSEPDTLKN